MRHCDKNQRVLAAIDALHLRYDGALPRHSVRHSAATLQREFSGAARDALRRVVRLRAAERSDSQAVFALNRAVERLRVVRDQAVHF